MSNQTPINAYSYPKGTVFNIQIEKGGYAKDGLLDDGYSEISYNKYNKTINVNKITMALDYHFKLSIKGLLANSQMTTAHYGEFLPIENMTFNPINVGVTSLSIGIFEDLPILSNRRMGRLNITLLDDTDNLYEDAVFDWFNGTCDNGFVAPLSEIIRQADYLEYRHDGKLSKHYRFWVIPEGSMTVSRAYNANTLKRISFSCIIVGDVEQVHWDEHTNYQAKEEASDHVVSQTLEGNAEYVVIDTKTGEEASVHYRSEREANGAALKLNKTTTIKGIAPFGSAVVTPNRFQVVNLAESTQVNTVRQNQDIGSAE